MGRDSHEDVSPDEPYESPAITKLGSVDELTFGDFDQDSVTMDGTG